MIYIISRVLYMYLYVVRTILHQSVCTHALLSVPHAMIKLLASIRIVACYFTATELAFRATNLNCFLGAPKIPRKQSRREYSSLSIFTTCAKHAMKLRGAIACFQEAAVFSYNLSSVGVNREIVFSMSILDLASASSLFRQPESQHRINKRSVPETSRNRTFMARSRATIFHRKILTSLQRMLQ